jgi:hypothetical protein
MDKLKDILWPIVLVGGLGAFIDFLIGKAGHLLFDPRRLGSEMSAWEEGGKAAGR